MERSEEELVETLVTGDIAAFEVILTRYEKAIWNHLRRLTGSTEDATDLTQETFIKLYQKRHLVDPAGNFKNWLYRVATNTAYDAMRKKHHIIEVPIDNSDESPETIPPELAYSITEEKILSHDIEQALSKITPHYRNILLLYYREGFGYEELSVLLEIPLNTVKTHLRRAKQSLREHLQNYG